MVAGAGLRVALGNRAPLISPSVDAEPAPR